MNCTFLQNIYRLYQIKRLLQTRQREVEKLMLETYTLREKLDLLELKLSLIKLLEKKGE